MKTAQRVIPEPREGTVGVRELKARASEILRRLESQPEGVVITRHGKPCARLVPIERAGMATGKRTLRNACPDGPRLTYEDFQEAKRMWDISLDGE